MFIIVFCLHGYGILSAWLDRYLDRINILDFIHCLLVCLQLIIRNIKRQVIRTSDKAFASKSRTFAFKCNAAQFLAKTERVLTKHTYIRRYGHLLKRGCHKAAISDHDQGLRKLQL